MAMDILKLRDINYYITGINIIDVVIRAVILKSCTVTHRPASFAKQLVNISNERQCVAKPACIINLHLSRNNLQNMDEFT